PAVRADDRGADVKQEARHQITSSAPLLIDTCGPSILMAPPWPLSISRPRAVREIFCPAAVWMRMPPIPGVSSSVMLFPPNDLMMTFWYGGTSTSEGTSAAEPHQQPV